MPRNAGMHESGVRIVMLKIPWMIFSTDRQTLTLLVGGPAYREALDAAGREYSA